MMRIRFSARVFLSVLALVLIGSYWGYRYYYQHFKYFGTFFVIPQPGNNHFIDHEIEFQSDSIPFAELTLIEEPGKPSETRHPFSLLANTKYKIRLHREEFEFSELNSKPLSKPLWIFPGYVVEQLDWSVPAEGVRFSGQQRSSELVTIVYEGFDGRAPPLKALLVISFRD